MFSFSENDNIDFSLLDSFETLEENHLITHDAKNKVILNSNDNTKIEQEKYVTDTKGNFRISVSGTNCNLIKSPISEPSSKLTYERKFPGPAGLFPKRQHASPTMHIDNGSINKRLENQDDIRSQKSDIILGNAPWQYFYTRIDKKCKEAVAVLQKFKISTLKRLTVISRSSPCKIPLFSAMVLHIDCSVVDPSIILKDNTGEINGTLHRDIWDKYSSFLTIGSIIFLRNVGVLYLYNSQHLNITLGNLISIYVPSSDEDKEEYTKEIMIHDDFPTDEYIHNLQKKWDSYISNLELKVYQRRSNSLANSPGNNNSSLFTIQSPISSPTLKAINNLKSLSPNNNNISNHNRSTAVTNSKKFVNNCEKSIVVPNVPCPLNLQTTSFSPPVSYKASNKFQIKKPRFDASMLHAEETQTRVTERSENDKFSIIGSSVNSEDESIVSSVLEGIDAESIFDDF